MQPQLRTLEKGPTHGSMKGAGAQEGVRWLSASMPARMVRKFLQQANRAMALAYARPYALTAFGSSIVIIGLLIHNRSLRTQLRSATDEVSDLRGKLAKVRMHAISRPLPASPIQAVHACPCLSYISDILSAIMKEFGRRVRHGQT